MAKEAKLSRFDSQHEDEEVLMLFRRHPVVMRKGLLAILAMLLVGMIPVSIWPTNLKLLWLIPASLVLGSVVMFYYWIGWYFSVFIVTDQRLVQISQKGLFDRSFVDVGLSKIQNINYQVSGIQETILGFGTILVQTFVGDLVIDRIHRPQEIQEKILKIIKDLGVDTSIESQLDDSVEMTKKAD